MDDLRLWELLRDDVTPPGDELVSLLEGLRGLPPAERVPFYAGVLRQCQHPEARVRLEAARCLFICPSALAFEALVRLLDDEVEEVRLGALASFRRATQSNDSAFVHALMHPRAEVRVAAVKECGDALSPLAFFLVADDATRDLVLDRAEAPPYGLPALLTFIRDGLLDNDQAVRLIGQQTLLGLSAFLELAPPRSPEDIAATLNPDTAEVKGTDALDDLIRIHWRTTELKLQSTFFQRVRAQLQTGLASRFAASLVAVMCSEPDWLPIAVNALVFRYPVWLSAEMLPRATRSAAVEGLLKDKHRWSLSDDELKRLVSTFPVRVERGIDLKALAAVLRYRPKPYDDLAKLLKKEELAKLYFRNPREGTHIVLMPEYRSSTGIRQRYIDHLTRDPEKGASVFAAQALMAPADKLDFIDKLSLELRAVVAIELMGLLADGSTVLSEPKLRNLCTHLCPKMAGTAFQRFLIAWVRAPEGEAERLGGALVSGVAKESPTGAFVRAFVTMPAAELKIACERLEALSAFPAGKLSAIAERLRTHKSLSVQRWAEQRVAAGPPPPAPPPPVLSSPISEAELASLASVTSPDEFTRRVHKLCVDKYGQGLPRSGLCDAIEASPLATPSSSLFTGLLGCSDADAHLRPTLARALPQPLKLPELDRHIVSTWNRAKRLNLVGHAMLYKWERHCFPFMALLEAAPDPSALLTFWLGCPADIVRQRVIAALARGVELLAAREPERLERLAGPSLIELCIDLLDTELGASAARVIMALLKSRTELSELSARRDDITKKLPDCSEVVRKILKAFVDGGGFAPASGRPRSSVREVEGKRLADVRASSDMEFLLEAVRTGSISVRHEAVLKLVELGEPGQLALVELLREDTQTGWAEAVTSSIELWDSDSALNSLETLLDNAELTELLRFRICMGLHAHRKTDALLEAAIDIAARSTQTGWFKSADWDALLERSPDPAKLCVALATSHHGHAYLNAVRWLLDPSVPVDEEVRDAAFLAFLRCGATRMRSLRRQVVRERARRGAVDGAHLLFADAMRDKPEAGWETLFSNVPSEWIGDLVESTLIIGANERKLGTMLEVPLDPGAWSAATEVVLREGQLATLREALVKRRGPSLERAGKLNRIAEVFAWALRISRSLTGSVLRPQMISGKELGYTRLNEQRIYVTPLPILRRDRNGRQIVEGLVLHEIGHHVYHKGPENALVWNRAQKQRLHGLLNLVADEHLERNLRALDRSYGDRLKRLAAYAFQHLARDVEVEKLVVALQSRAFDVLSRSDLQVSREPGCVRIHQGELLQSLERQGDSFARFVRAVRMGLGNRHDDPKVEEALALFGRSFRKSNMEQLWEVTLELVRIFGGEVQLCDMVGGHEHLPSDERDGAVHGDGISDGEVQQEVERILGPPKKGKGGRDGKPRRLAINVAEDEQFPRILEIEPVLPEPVSQRAVANEVKRHAVKMRRFLHELGLGYQPQRMRLSGMRFDRSRTNAVVLRGDPRMLIARERVVKTDLFMGLVIDCSGSMSAMGSMEKAHRFGTLLTEAARGLPGIDVRVLGFTDRKMYDAGDARRPAVTALKAGGGNNDAGALAYAADIAHASRRRAKLLIMISDGLPTECSVAALRGLVTHLSKRERICCAQVAVRPLSEICFPHYVEIADGEMDDSVRRFGRVITKLVRRVLK